MSTAVKGRSAAAMERWQGRGHERTIGGRIRLLREARGWSQEDLGARVHRSKSLISLLESDRQFPSVYVLRDLRRLLGVSVDYVLFGGEEGGR